MDDDGIIRRRAFDRKARQATHQILFYLELFYRPVTLLTRATHRRTDQVLHEDSERVLARLRALVAGVGYRGDAGVESRSWKTLRDKIETCVGLWPYREQDDLAPDDEKTDRKLRELRETCAEFLRESRPQDLVAIITHFLNRGVLRLFRNLAEVLVVGAAVFLLLGLPQVAGLVRQVWGGTILLGVLFAIPGLIGDRLERSRNRRGQQYWWDLGGASFRNWAARPPERGFGRFADSSRVPFALVVRIAANMGTYLVTLVVALGLAWFLSWWKPILLTVAMILAVLFVLFGVARLLDFWDYYDPAPVRMVSLVLVLIALFGVNTFNLLLAPVILCAIAAGFGLWFLWHVRRSIIAEKRGFLGALRANGRTAALTAGVSLLAWIVFNIAATQFGKPWQDDGSTIERISGDSWPKSVRKLPQGRDEPVVVLAASGGGSRAAIYVAYTLLLLHENEFSHIGCNLQAISSVSGGSLANALYVAQRLKEPGCGPELLTRLNGKHGLMEGVAGDFLEPTIYGALRGTALGHWFGGGGRSEAIEDAWKKIGLRVDLAELARKWRDAPEGYPPFPVPLFNSTSLEAHRVVISPLQYSVYAEPMVSQRARDANLYDRIAERFPDFKDKADEPTWVYYRDGIYGLDNLLPGFTPNLAQCVRASANFPVGFPLVKVETTQPLWYSPDKNRRKSGKKKAKDNVYLTDGGVLSNSGFWSLYHLLRNQYANLVERGVLVIIVDASGMQNYREPTRIQGLFGAIGSQQPIGQSLHRQMFESLKEQYGERIQFVQIDLIPTTATNIETTWTLSKESQESLSRQFAARRPEFEADLDAAWKVLVGKRDEGPRRYLERPPVD